MSQKVRRIGYIESTTQKAREIYVDDTWPTVADKIWNNFGIGDKVRIYKIEPIKFKVTEHPNPKIPKNIVCEIVGGETGGYFVMYPQGYLITQNLMRRTRANKEFAFIVGIDSQGKHYYEIWRSK